MEKSLASSFCEFLQNPSITVRVADSEEVDQLHKEVDQLRQSLHRAESRLSLYAVRCLAYEDYLKSKGIRPTDICR